MSRRILVHNAGPGALVFTQGGRVLSPHKTAESDPGDPVTARLVAAGRLIDVTPTQEAPVTGVEAHEPAEGTTSQVAAPAGNAPRTEWEAYALTQGLTETDLEGLGRNDIRDLLTDGDTPAGEENTTDSPVDGETSTQTATSPGDADTSEKEQ
ncbi:hypothetical protein [Nesterenkonia sp. HG001]|uniref:hypothetical protein n=1 Tax=Nesterenkonia sp. HG001 TaxID=2983207 RepID=UPI002AC5A6BF|nr:hypothetical protein [Nesterenkonia sp. HG001]MDZ5076737.1 hypothetical protein [Nesterenkonia sp. HG001]